MAAYFDAMPHALGPVMMTSTASIQVNLDAGADPADVARRWELLHLVGPALSAAFANSPRAQRAVHWMEVHPAGRLVASGPAPHPSTRSR